MKKILALALLLCLLPLGGLSDYELTKRGVRAQHGSETLE